MEALRPEFFDISLIDGKDMNKHNTDTGDAPQIATGVQKLIDKLHDQGVEKGRSDAEAITSDAQRRADWIIKQAEAEAQALLTRAQHEAAQLQKSGGAALKMASRDIQIQIKDSLLQGFARQLNRVVAQQLKDTEFLGQLILAVARDETQDVNLNVRGGVELLVQGASAGGSQSEFDDFVRSFATGVLQEGVEIKIGLDGAGLRVRLVEKNIEIDLTDDAITELLLAYVQPRIRDMLEGAI